MGVAPAVWRRPQSTAVLRGIDKRGPTRHAGRMFGRFRVQPLLLAVLLLAVSTGCDGAGVRPRDVQTVDGVIIYLGVMLTALISGHPIHAGERGAMHGGAPGEAGSRHVVVALFDAGTGTRIQAARVRAGVGHGHAGLEPDRDLEPMLINDVVTFGNFFPMPQAGDYRIRIEIARPDGQRTIEADFDYRNH